MQNHHKNDRTKPHGLMAESGALSGSLFEL